MTSLLTKPVTVSVLLMMMVLIPVQAALVRLFGKRSDRPRLVWGPAPLINIKYWSKAMKEGGFSSTTFMQLCYPHITKPEDFDLYMADVVRLPGFMAWMIPIIGPYWAFLYALWNFDIFHQPFSGGFLGLTRLWWLEGPVLRWARKKVVTLPFGGDVYALSRIEDPCLRHCLLLSYPALALEERRILQRMDYWTKYTDALLPGLQIDAVGRWDALPVNAAIIDLELWQPKVSYSKNDGRNGPVRVLHTPNHRGFKGTEFLIAAVEALQADGLQIELTLIEKTPNDVVRRLMAEEADILAEQFIFIGYAVNAIEGMASGLPVMSNLDNERYTRIFRRYSHLNECPILSTTPETIQLHLRELVTRPELREALGRAGRQYVEKYHSPTTAQYLFGSVYDRIWHGQDTDLMSLFHPHRSTYVRGLPRVAHPLSENRLPNGDVAER